MFKFPSSVTIGHGYIELTLLILLITVCGRWEPLHINRFMTNQEKHQGLLWIYTLKRDGQKIVSPNFMFTMLQ